MSFKKFVRYACAGAGGTLVHYGILVLLVSGGKTGPVLGSTLGAAVGAVINYLLNYLYTFESKAGHASVAPKFFVVAIAAMVVNWGVMRFLIKGLSIYYLVAQFIATGTVLVTTYMINRAWAFKQDAPDTRDQAK